MKLQSGGFACAALLLLAARLAVAAPEVEVKPGASLRVLVDATEPPEMFSIAGGKQPGLSRELLEGFAHLHRMELKVVTVKNWDDIIPALLRGDGDLITGIIATDTRRKQVEFSAELLPSRHLAVSRKPQPVIATVEALRAARVAVLGGTSWAEAARAAGVPAANLQNYPDTSALLDALKTSKAEAAVMSLTDFTLALRHDPALQAGVFIGPHGSSAWAIRKQDAALKAALDEFIANNRRSMAWSRLVVKYFGPDALAVLGRAKED